MPLEVNGKHRGNFIVDTGAVTTVISHNMAANLGVKADGLAYGKLCGRVWDAVKAKLPALQAAVLRTLRAAGGLT